MQLPGAATMARAEVERRTVLVVDPSAEVRRVARMALALAGYGCREAADAAAALVLLRSLSPAAIVTGVAMAGPCDGIGLCDIVRSRIRLRNCPVVVLTCRSDPDRLRRIGEAGASAVLPQPFSPTRLVAVVDEAVGHFESTVPDHPRQQLSLLSLMTTLAITDE